MKIVSIFVLLFSLLITPQCFSANLYTPVYSQNFSYNIDSNFGFEELGVECSTCHIMGGNREAKSFYVFYAAPAVDSDPGKLTIEFDIVKNSQMLCKFYQEVPFEIRKDGALIINTGTYKVTSNSTDNICRVINPDVVVTQTADNINVSVQK
jgi:hypothetical protein